MARGTRVMRYVIISMLLLLGLYKISSNSVDLSEYTLKSAAANANTPVSGSTGGLANADKKVEEKPAEKAAEKPAEKAAEKPAEKAAEKPAEKAAEKPAEKKPEEKKPEEKKAEKPAEKAAEKKPEEKKAEKKPEEKPVEKKIDGDYVRENATFVSLARNQDLWALVDSIREVESKFNKNYHYDWVFLNDGDFDDEFRSVTTKFVSGKTHYGKISEEHWGYPDFIDQEKAAFARERMNNERIIYGGSESYRHMCRFESGFFWRQPVMDQFKYYWRVEPHIKLFCDIDFDVFKFMRENKKKYAFTISLYEYAKTIPTLWETTKKFMKEKPEYLHKNNALEWISNDNGETYNLCHFWSNFEVGDLDFWRGPAYRAYFDHLDRAGGFFYERWGDAPVHSIGAALFLDKSEIHFFDNIGYYHVPFQSCPTDEEVRAKLHCSCPNNESLPPDQRHIFTFKGYSCTPRWYQITGLKRPKNWFKDPNP